MKRILLVIAVAMVAVVGCHGQIPSTNHTVTVGWTGPSGCSGCTFVISAATVSGSTCPTPNGSNYAPLNQSSPATGTSYTDSANSGKTVCYVGQTLQGSAVSVASNTAGPVTVPSNPTAPVLGTPAVAANVHPVFMPTPNEQVASLGHLTVRVN